MMWVFIGAGGFLGAISRLYVTRLIKPFSNEYPYGTLLVNIIGSFFLGIVTKLELEHYLPYGYFFIGAGFLGSFTTFSTFSLDTVFLFKRKGMYHSFIYLMIHLLLGICAAGIGYYLF